MQQFGRQWQLDISNESETLSISQLRIAFHIDKTINEKPNPAKIEIWNLNRNHINQLLSGHFKSVSLAVGYTQLTRLYSGDIIKVFIRRDGLDFILQLECGDGHQAYTTARSAITLKSGASDEDIIKAVQQTLPKVQLGEIVLSNQRKLPRGRVLNGDSREILNRVARNHQADWSIQDGQLIFLPKENVLNGEAVVLSQQTGLVGSPEQTDDGLTLRCLLNPLLRIGSVVQLESILPYFKGEYKIVKLSHSGDGLNGDWLSEMMVVGGKFKKMENAKKPQKENSPKNRAKVVLSTYNGQY